MYRYYERHATIPFQTFCQENAIHVNISLLNVDAVALDFDHGLQVWSTLHNCFYKRSNLVFAAGNGRRSTASDGHGLHFLCEIMDCSRHVYFFSAQPLSNGVALTGNSAAHVQVVERSDKWTTECFEKWVLRLMSSPLDLPAWSAPFPSSCPSPSASSRIQDISIEKNWIQ